MKGNAFIDTTGRLQQFKPDEQMVDQELAKEIIKYAYTQVCWNYSDLSTDPENYYYHTEEFCYHELCMVTIQFKCKTGKLRKLMVRTPELIMVFHEIPDGVDKEMSDLSTDAWNEYKKNKGS